MGGSLCAKVQEQRTRWKLRNKSAFVTLCRRWRRSKGGVISGTYGGENDYPIEIAKEAYIKALKSGDPVAIATAKVEKARVFSSHTKSIGGLSGSLDDTSVKTTGALLVNAIIICNLFNCLFATVESEQLQNRMFLPHSW